MGLSYKNQKKQEQSFYRSDQVIKNGILHLFLLRLKARERESVCVKKGVLEARTITKRWENSRARMILIRLVYSYLVYDDEITEVPYFNTHSRKIVLNKVWGFLTLGRTMSVCIQFKIHSCGLSLVFWVLVLLKAVLFVLFFVTIFMGYYKLSLK